MILLLIFLSFMLFDDHSLRAGSTVGLSIPLCLNTVSLPILRKHLSYVDLVELLTPVLEAHPPSTIRFFCLEYILELLLQGSVLVPVIGILAESAVPNTITSPRISDSDQSQVFLRKFSEVEDAIKMILKDSLRALISCLC